MLVCVMKPGKYQLQLLLPKSERFIYLSIPYYTMKIVVIKISKRVKDKLDKLKVHPRQSYNEVIAKLIKNGK